MFQSSWIQHHTKTSQNIVPPIRTPRLMNFQTMISAFCGASCSGFCYVYCFLILQDKLPAGDSWGEISIPLLYAAPWTAPILPLSCGFGRIFWPDHHHGDSSLHLSGSPFVHVPSTIVHVWAIWELHWCICTIFFIYYNNTLVIYLHST